MTFKEKILSKSNSYNYYKEKNDSLVKEIENLKKELESEKNKNNGLTNELDKVKNITLREKFRELYARPSGFCGYAYVDYYFQEDFEDKFKNITQHLDSESKYFFKWLYIRSVASNIVTQETMYSKQELADQKKYWDYKLAHTSENQVGEYKFTGGYNLHPFVDLNLNDADAEFLKNKDIIDAGAFTGDTSIPLAKYTTGNVYAFEPFDESFELLNKNIKDNNIDNVIPVKKSLGNNEGVQTLYLSGTNVQGITSDKNARNYDTELKVEETTVDKFVEENDLNVGFITIDVEGGEMDLLNGALNTIKTQKPILSISIYHKISDFMGIIPWVADLDLGYEFEIVKEQPWGFISDTSVQCRVKQ